jgi:non-specific serine/threonine protein kinase
MFRRLKTRDPETIGRYRIQRKLGEGGMGVVYAAEDERLGRAVAIKKLHPDTEDPSARERLWREARAAARVNHPSVCQVYEIAEEEGEPYIVMELLEGESLAVRMTHGPIAAAEAASILLDALNALDALHRAGFIHRDLKPSNMFLTASGVKLLDFGLARRHSGSPESNGLSALDLTKTGMIIGTPRYMSPEQARSEPVDATTDLFAAGTILFEMLSGRAAFEGRTPVEVFHAVLNEQPPALGGSPRIVALDRVIRTALAKKSEDRYRSAAAMAEAVRAALLAEEDSAAAAKPASAAARPVTRLVVLPFQVLRADPEIDFLSFSLPDAISSQLAGLNTLVVRSSLAAARYTGRAVDLKAIAAEMDVDVVLTGTLLRAGDRLRVTAQLTEAPEGALLWSRTSEVALDDIFRLQDGIVREILQSLALPLTNRERRLLGSDVPGTARAYEFYLRANQLANDSKSWKMAGDLYRECLRDDPDYAPAWARLGRILRLLAKFFPGEHAALLPEAEQAFERALALNPDLSLAHNYYSQFEVEEGRTTDALRRLLTRAAPGSSDPEIYVGLVHVLRYCGFLEASIAADACARRLDPGVRTSVGFSYFMLGDNERAASSEVGPTAFTRLLALVSLGRIGDALAGYKEAVERVDGVGQLLCRTQIAALEGDRDQCLELLSQARVFMRDPEGRYLLGRTQAFVADEERALETLESVVGAGFFCARAFIRDPWLDPVRANRKFAEIVRSAEARQREAVAVYTECRGEALLGPPR